MSMFFEKEYEPSSVGCELNDKELQEFLNKHNITLTIVDNSTRWCAYAQYYGLTTGLDIVTSTSFSYMASLFMTGMGISAGTEQYFKEETLELDLIDELNHIRKEIINEKEQVIKMFYTIVDIYTTDKISKYEYATERLSLKLTPSQMNKFQNIPGDNYKDKFINLLNKTLD